MSRTELRIKCEPTPWKLSINLFLYAFTLYTPYNLLYLFIKINIEVYLLDFTMQYVLLAHENKIQLINYLDLNLKVGV